MTLTRFKISAFILLMVLFFNLELNSQPLQLLCSVNPPGTEHDLWGYVDSNGVEYAFVASTSGMYIYNISNPSNPQLISVTNNDTLTHTFDIKIWKNYAYTVTGFARVIGKIFDISDIANPIQVGTFPDAHNIFISNTGYLINCEPGFKIFDLNQDPANPVLVFEENSMNSHDAAVIGDRLFDFHNQDTHIYEATNLQNPVHLATVPGSHVTGFSHSGWNSEDGNYLLRSGESDRIAMWDIRNYNDIILTDMYIDTNSTVHNIMIKGRFAFVSNYARGLRVFDISNPSNLRLVAEYDPHPGSAPGLGGTFGVYTMLPSGIIIASDTQEGLMIFNFDSTQVGIVPISTIIPSSFSLSQNYPNPFNPSTKIKFDIPKNSGLVKLAVYNTLGQEVAILVNNALKAGTYEYSFDGSALPSGIYFYKLQSVDFTRTKKMVLVK